VNSFCQIFKDLNDGKKCSIKNIDDDASASSLHSMIIYGLVDYEDITKTNMNENDKHLARICAGQHKHEKAFDFKYLNEMNTLLLSRNQISNEDIINSRFSDGEEVVLDATLLDSLNSY
jgi:NurA-like 5'-3' nuclease